MQQTDTMSDHDRGTLDRIRETAAWREAEQAREAERVKRHAALAKERAALVAETEGALATANDRHMKALAVVEEATAKLEAARDKAREFELAAYGESRQAQRRINMIDGDLAETAPPCIAEARAWARSAFDDGRGGRKPPGQRVATDSRGRDRWAYKTEELRVAAEHIGLMAQTDRGPLHELEVSDLSPAKVETRVAELRAKAEELLAAAFTSDRRVGAIRKVVEAVAKVLDVHEARAAQASEAEGWG